MEKLRNLIVIIVFLFVFFIIFTNAPRSYEYRFEIDNINVTEKFDKKNKVYSYVFKNDESVYRYSLEHKYVNARGLIEKIKILDNCMYVESKKLNAFSVCKNENGYHTTYCDKNIEEKQIDKYEHITIYDYNNRKYYIWNYTEFLSIEQSDHKKIELFENDIYELDLIIKLNNYLVVADYNQKYKFNKLYMINTKNDDVKESMLNREIYFNSYILGTNKKNIYIYDIQKEKEYKINPFKENVTKNAYEILVEGQWEKVSVNKLNKKNVFFKNSQNFYYFLDDGVLYYQTPNEKIKITKLNVTNIIESNEKEAYFISGDTLYFVNIDKGIKKIMKYSEWNFTNKNIYVF